MMNDGMKKISEEMTKQKNIYLRKKFTGLIKESFLIKVKSMIINDGSLLPLLQEKYRILSLDPMKNIHFGDCEVEICKFITMQHMYNVEMLSETERKALEGKKEYQEKLKLQVVDMIKVNEFSNNFKSENSLLSYKPGNFYIYVGSKYIDEFIRFLIETDKQLNNLGNYIFSCILIMVNNIKAIMLLMESSKMIQAYSILRNLVELYISFMLCYHNNYLVHDYLQYQVWLEEYEKTNEYPEAFIIEYNNETLQVSPKPSKINFLHNGWITGYLKKIRKRDIRYTFKDVSNLVNDKSGTNMYEVYEHCCQFTHTNILTKSYEFQEPEMDYIRYYCCLILIKCIDIIKQLSSVTFNVNDVDIEKKIRDIMKVLNERKSKERRI